MSATPLYKFLKDGYSTYVVPGASEDISAAYQNDNYNINFSKFMLLNIDLSKMDFTNPDQFNTESFNIITDKGELLINSLRNYVANHESVIRETRVNNNTYFYDPNQLQTTSEKIFWKWLRKTGAIQFEPAIPNDEYVDLVDFAVNDNAPDDYFKEYLWKERSVIKYSVTNIVDTGELVPDPENIGNYFKVYEITVGSSSTIKPNDTVIVKSEGTFQIFDGDIEKNFLVSSVDTSNNEDSKNDLIRILVDQSEPIFWNNFAVVSLKLKYDKVVQYIGEISSINNVQMANRSYTEVVAYIPDQNGQTPDILFRVGADKNYGPGNQYPILPSQDQPEIIGGELAESPIVLNPELFPGDQYAYFDIDQKYINSSGALDRRRGEYYGIIETNRKKSRVVEAPYVYPEFDGFNIDGLGVDFDYSHYVKMNLPGKISKNFDEFNAQSFNNLPPKDFEFNLILWYYQVEDLTKPAANNTGINLYGFTFVNPVVDDKLETYKKLVSNGKQDGLSYQFNINLNFNINNDNVTETYDPQKVYSIFGFDLYNEVMTRIAKTNEIFLTLATSLSKFQEELANLKSLMYTQTDVRNINFRIDSLYKLLDLYKRHQIKDSETIKVTVDETVNPPLLILESKDSRYGMIQQIPVSTLYNSQNNTVINYKLAVPSGKDFLVNIINDDNSDINLGKPLNIVLDRDLDYRQSAVFKIYPKDAQFNKQLNISMITKLVDNVDKVAGYKMIKTLDLPIDKNLNANIVTDGIIKRWNNIPISSFTPETVSIKKVTDNYFITIGVKPLQINSFKVGDVITLDNFNIVYKTTKVDISGQYPIIGEIQNNTFNLQIVADSTLPDFAEIFRLINEDQSGISNEYLLDGTYFTQPMTFRINTGYTITITNIDRSSTTLDEKYMIEIENLKIDRL
jgi:hypothetical protein